MISLWFALIPGVTLAAAEEALVELVVSGGQPGPGLWKLTHEDHVLYIMGTMTPLPAKMQWRSAAVETIVAGSQQVIEGVNVKADADIGLIKGVRLLRAALRARAIPDGKRLQDILTPATYARWAVAKQRYLKGNDKVEGLRPVFAGGALYESARGKVGLVGGDVVWPAIERVAKRHDIPIRRPTITVQIDDPAALIRDFAATPMSQDIRCFESLLLLVERDLPQQARRANAWATGDIDALRADPPEDSWQTCMDVMTRAPRLAQEFAAAERRARQEWVLAAEGALLRNRQSFATLRMRDILRPDGLLAELTARGYVLTEP